MDKKNNITLGIYYEKDNEIYYTYGFKDNKVLYFGIDGIRKEMTQEELIENYTSREDLKDFPTPTPWAVLPYVFDLSFDVNNLSDLNYQINQKEIDADEVMELLENDEIWEGYHKSYIIDSIYENCYENDIDFKGKETIDFDM